MEILVVKGGDYRDNALLKIIENKIRASEHKNGIDSCEDIWETYFESTINKTEVRKYILNNSWYRPRDVVRMMKLVQDQYKGEEKFNQEMFDKAQQEYSRKMWNEVSEELILTYSSEDLKAIKKFFTNISVPFDFSYLKRRVLDLGEIYENVKKFFDKVKLVDFLEKMYEWGIIGNSGKRMVFCFLEDDDFSPLEKMIIHKPLRNFFSVKSQEE